MDTLKKFTDNLCGNFNNDEQIKKQEKEGKVTHPKAKHVNRIANNKFINLPNDFKGYFIIEESYYEMGNRKNILPHLFLFTLNEDNQVVLTSYDLPEGISKEEFRNDNNDLIIDYNKLVKSEKFNPMVYKEVNEGFEGESISDFGGGVKFTLKERTERDKLYVSEVFEKNGKITFGFIEPIIYHKEK